MVSLRALDVRLRPQTQEKLYSLAKALPLIGITAPTFYRWLKSRKIEDPRRCGPDGKTYLRAEAIVSLREQATLVQYAI